MPLLDHFRPPLSSRRQWQPFYSAWVGSIADVLNDELLPFDFFAEEMVQTGTTRVTDEDEFDEMENTWNPPKPTATTPITVLDTFQVQIFAPGANSRLIAVVELVSPNNKDRPQAQRAFAVKCANNLYQGISVVVVDIVANRRANLHNEIMKLLNCESATAGSQDGDSYAVAYHPFVCEKDESAVDQWVEALAIGEKLPVLPLFLNAVDCLPIDLEATYTDACRRRRIGV